MGQQQLLRATKASPGINVVPLEGGCAQGSEEEPRGDSPRPEEGGQPLLRGAGICKWFNVRMGFGFLSMTSKEGVALDSPVDVFVHQVRGRRAAAWGLRAKSAEGCPGLVC
ncbi:UNVERIFIED_CONTAM: hypothetical protein K2H54_052125 [Gekko kuhli]